MCVTATTKQGSRQRRERRPTILEANCLRPLPLENHKQAGGPMAGRLWPDIYTNPHQPTLPPPSHHDRHVPVLPLGPVRQLEMARPKIVGRKTYPVAAPAAPTSSSKPVAKKQQKQKQPKLMINSKRQKQEKAEPRKREKKEEAHAEEEEEDEEEAEEEEEEEEESVPRKSSHMGGMRGLMMRGGAEGSSSSDSGGSDDEDEEDEMEQDDSPPQKGSKKGLLSTAAADAASKKQASATLKAATTKGTASTTTTTTTTITTSSSSSSAAAAAVKFDGSYKNRQRVLVFCSRGVTARYRHLLEDLRKLIPHHKKDVKLDCKGDLQVINEIAEVKSCNNSLFLEARKRQDLYLWLSKTPLGPSIKFNVLNVHTLDELRLTGNAMLGSRPLLSFDLAFEAHPHTRLIKALLTDTFGTPRGHPKSKPFVDRVLSFALADGKVWVRNYQIVDTAPVATVADPLATDKAEAKAAAKTAAADKKKGAAAGGEGGNEDELTSLVEIGPRFVLNPIRIFSGSFGGPTLYQNPSFISPNFVRSEKKRTEGARLAHKMKADSVRKERKAKAVLPKDELQELF